MPKMNAYLTFNGNGREAMAFYKECFGGELFIQSAGDSPVADKVPPQFRNQLLHGSLTSGDLVLMASDNMGHSEFIAGNNVSLSVNCGSEQEIKSLFAKLSAGGTVRQALEVQFWGALFGQLTDKFGINWMFNYEMPKK